MAQPSAQEQYLLELVNRFRANPAAEYNFLVNSGDGDVISSLSYFGVNLSVLASQWGSLVAAQPLAWSDQLNSSATAHNQLMINFNQQSHNLPGEPGLSVRINNAGANSYNAVAENIYAYAQSPFHAHAGFAVDWGDNDTNAGNGFGTGIQNPTGHRNNLLNDTYREAGFSLIAENNSATAVGPLVATQHLGDRNTGTSEWLLGVAFRDMDDNDFYSTGEGLGGVTVNISKSGFSTSVQTGLAGGYQTLLPPGTYSVKFSQNGTTLKNFSNVVVGAQSVKKDLLIEVGVAPAAGRGKIVGMQFNDADGDGVQDIGESGIAGRTVFLDGNGNGQLNVGESSVVTDASGVYIFNSLLPGSYQVLPVIPAGRAQTFPNSVSPLGSESFQLDDSTSEGWAAFTPGSDVLVFNQFAVQSGSRTLTSLSVGLSEGGNPTKLLVYQDTDNDGRPDDNEKVREVATALTGTTGFANVAIAPTSVTGTFFVGAFYKGNSTDYTLVPRDKTSPAGKSWQASVVNSNSFPNSFTASLASAHNWLLRANAEGLQPQVVSVKANKTVGGVNFGDRSTSFTGTSGADTLNGTNNADTILGLGGNDLINGLLGNDTIDGGTGNDTILGGGGADILMGGSNTDTLDYSDSQASVVVTLGSNVPSTGGTAEGDVNSGFENLVGSNFADTLLGDAGNNILRGGLGNDLLTGAAGNDTVLGGGGADTMDGGTGTDILNYTESLAAVTVTLSSGTGVGGDAQGDTNIGFERIVGSNFNDVLTGDAAANLLSGGNGDDLLSGGGSSDTLNGEGGNDILIGGGGNDSLTGGAGLDSFQFLAVSDRTDTITDFSGDRIQILGAGFGGGLTTGLLDAGKFVLGTSATTSAHRFVYNNGALYFDVDGLGGASQSLIANVKNGGSPALMSASDIQIF
jgi:Ca2+-binding RTX toxin-like protein